MKVFDSRILEIIEIHHSVEYFICYTSTEALICSQDKGLTLKIVHRFFKALGIKSILAELVIKKIVAHLTSDMKLTIAVLLNDESLYIYDVELNNNNSWSDSIKLVKHIHPVEQIYSHFKHLEPNNSELHLIFY